MPISILKYQPVSFKTAQEYCGCGEKEYCSLVNRNDATQWQLLSSNLIVNGSFEGDISDWDQAETLIISVDITNESTDGACNGGLIISALTGTGPYTYSIDGIIFSSSNTFTDICVGCYNIVVKDSLGNIGFAIACVDTNVTCGGYNNTNELLPFNTSQFLNCLTSDFI
jgi:hypothetical protein